MRAFTVSLLAAPAFVSALVTPVRRSFSGMATYYYTQTGNAGSCGDYLNDGEYTVAVNSGQYNQDMCNKKITIWANGKSVQATVKDECPEGGGNCHYGDLDLSPGLFEFFNPLSVGKFSMDWDFADSGAPAPAPEPQPTTTYVEPAPPVDLPTAPTVDTSFVEYVPPTTTSAYVEAEATVPTTSPTDYVQPDTTTSTSSPETTTSTLNMGQKLLQAMGADDMYGMGEALMNLGSVMMYPTSTPTPVPTY
jgi:hypothetical protein